MSCHHTGQQVETSLSVSLRHRHWRRALDTLLLLPLAHSYQLALLARGCAVVPSAGERNCHARLRPDSYTPCSFEVEVTRVTCREVSYIALDKTLSGTLQQWQFLQNFQPMPERKKKVR